MTGTERTPRQVLRRLVAASVVLLAVTVAACGSTTTEAEEAAVELYSVATRLAAHVSELVEMTAEFKVQTAENWQAAIIAVDRANDYQAGYTEQTAEEALLALTTAMFDVLNSMTNQDVWLEVETIRLLEAIDEIVAEAERLQSAYPWLDSQSEG